MNDCAANGDAAQEDVSGQRHLLIAPPPNLDLSTFVNNLTTISRLLDFSEQLERVYPKPVFWSARMQYFA
jgi:hypothetical protein